MAWNIFYLFTVVIELIIRYNITSSKQHKRFRGCCIAVFAQFLWVIIFLKSGQSVLLGLTAIDFCIWCRGCYRNFPRK
jgi:hypothetical protein